MHLQPNPSERGRFLSHLQAEQFTRWRWRLITDLPYQDPLHGTLRVPAGFVTNFASVRALRLVPFPLYSILVGYGNAATTVHDWLYSPECPLGLTRAECDAVLYRALRAEGVARWRAVLFYVGVQIWGGSHFQTPRPEGEY
jgi:hypothetical protein